MWARYVRRILFSPLYTFTYLDVFVELLIHERSSCHSDQVDSRAYLTTSSNAMVYCILFSHLKWGMTFILVFSSFVHLSIHAYMHANKHYVTIAFSLHELIAHSYWSGCLSGFSADFTPTHVTLDKNVPSTSQSRCTKS